MKIKRILFISVIIGIVILIFLIVLNVGKKKYHNTKPINEVIEESSDNIENENGNSINDKISFKVNNKINNSESIRNDYIKDNSKLKSEKNEKNYADIIMTDDDRILIKNTYYYQPNWMVEEVVISEEKENLSFFEKIDGKKAKVTKKTKVAYKWLRDINDENSYIKNSFILVPIATGSDIAYKYYFDSSGYLITDNISKDYTVLDSIGREIDKELRPVEYYIGSKDYSIEHIEKSYDSKEDVYYGNVNRSINSTPSQIIITEGVVFRNKLEKIFNTLIDRDMTKYIVGGSGYQTNAKGNTFKNGQWKKALKLRSNGSYITFENHINNFNKVTGKIAMESTSNSDRETSCRLVVYDKEEYDKGNLDEYLYYNDEFNYTEQKVISFTFDRSIKNVAFVLYVDGKYKNRSVYFKDLKFGFSKSAYIEELTRKREEKEEIENLKSLGLYVEEDSYFDIIDEDGEIIDEIDEEVDDIEDFFDNDKYYDDLVDRKSGPAFDEELKKLSERRVGPYYDIVGTKSEIKDKQRKSKTIYTE